MAKGIAKTGKALMVWGGWDGHEPKQVGADSAPSSLAGNGFEVEVRDTLDVYLDQAKLRQLDLIVPVWTMGKISQRAAQGPAGGGRRRRGHRRAATAAWATPSARTATTSSWSAASGWRIPAASSTTACTSWTTPTRSRPA